MDAADFKLVLAADTFVVIPIGALDSFELQPRIAPAIAELVVGFFQLGEKRLAQLAGAETPAPELLAAEPKPATLEEMAAAAGKFDIGSMDVGELAGDLLPLIGRFCAALKAPGELRALTVTLLATATMNDKPLFVPDRLGSIRGPQPFDALMVGRSIHTWQLLWHALRVNYRDFFAIAAALRGAAPAAASSAT